ncbi:putative xylose isomerase-like protein [Phytophthora infestans]|uniref:Putative xylose isomerase-like protein n=2 Tax=Phytophthora infestans TaxID=4787 RepID=A0A8S9V934_PHYIN|nr:putative xylose isomerase-like protein [Phytophthora infestans]
MASNGLRCFRSLWGSPTALKLASDSTAGSTGSYAQHLLAHIRRQGFDGIEASLGDLKALGGTDVVLPLLAENKLELIVGVYSGWVDYEPQNLSQQFEGVEAHVKRFREQLETVSSFSQRPREFLSRVHEIERELECHDILAHETHRGRMFYSPWPTLALLEEFPGLKLTLDFSHWCVVTERLLNAPEDEEWLLNKVVPRVRHVHGRVGTEHAAQLPYPLDELSRNEVERFQKLWDAVWTHQNEKAIGKRPTFTPEYGPIPYAPRHHDDQQFEAYNVDELCAQQAAAQRQKFDRVMQD